MKLLLAEDEKEFSRAVVAILERNNYSVDAVYDGNDALEYALNYNYDAIILDIMMPKLNGIEVLAKLRKQKISTPIMLLTAKSSVEDKIIGLDNGADDYLAKPFVMGEFISRIRALLRRRSSYTADILNFGNLKLNNVTYELSTSTGVVRLNNKEYQIAEMFFRNSTAIISAEQFMEHIWGWDSEAEINVVWVNISALRKKFELIGANSEIKATRGVGYSLELKL